MWVEAYMGHKHCMCRQKVHHQTRHSFDSLHLSAHHFSSHCPTHLPYTCSISHVFPCRSPIRWRGCTSYEAAQVALRQTATMLQYCCYYMPPKHQHHTTINFKYTTMAPNHWGSVQKEEIRSSLGCNKADSSVDIVWILLLSLLYYWNICTIAFTVTKCSGEICMLLSGTGEGGWFTFTHREKKYGYIWVWM